MGPDSETSGQAGRLRGGAETRERILRCMIDMIDRGLGDDIQLRDVAREAGVSAALIIRYFGSKSDLLFEALTTRMQETGNAQLAAKDAKGGFKSLDDLAKFQFAADLESGYRTVSMLEMSWRWTPEQEERWRATLEPRADILRRLVAGQASKAKAGELAAAAHLIQLAYDDILRAALVHSWTPAQALERFRPIRDGVLAALRANAFAA